MDKLLKLLGVILLTVAYMLYRLFVVIRVWGYIAVRLFDLPPIGLWKAFAVSSLIGLLTVRFTNVDEENRGLDKAAKSLIVGFLGLTLIWLIDWILFG